MKTLLLLFTFYFFTGAIPVEMDESSTFEDQKHETAGFKEPRFPGGEAAMNKFIQDNLVYPQESKAKGEEATINIHVKVTENGSLTNISTKDRRMFPAMADEAMRVVKLMPRWRAGEVNGRPCSIEIGFPVEFKLTK